MTLRNLLPENSSKKKNMKTPKLYLLLAFPLLFMATQCDDDDELSCNQQLEILSDLSDQIDTLIASSSCNDASECRYIAFGSKPCGGPWEYLVYSTSIDTLQLQNLVEEYNLLESDYNQNCDVVSDCLFVGPPQELSCENGQCTIVN